MDLVYLHCSFDIISSGQVHKHLSKAMLYVLLVLLHIATVDRSLVMKR
jgi:hypothetical protein